MKSVQSYVKPIQRELIKTQETKEFTDYAAAQTPNHCALKSQIKRAPNTNLLHYLTEFG